MCINKPHKQQCLDIISFFEINKNETIESYNKRLTDSETISWASSFLLKNESERVNRNEEVTHQSSFLTSTSYRSKVLGKNSVKNPKTLLQQNGNVPLNSSDIIIGNTANFSYRSFQQTTTPTYYIRSEADFGTPVDVNGVMCYVLSIGTYIFLANITPSFQLSFANQAGFEKVYTFTNLYKTRGMNSTGGLYNTFSDGIFYTPGNSDNDFDKLFLDCVCASFTPFLAPKLLDITNGRAGSELRFCSNFRLENQFGLGLIDGVSHVNSDPGAYISSSGTTPNRLNNVQYANFVGTQGMKDTGGTSSFLTISGGNTQQHVYSACEVDIEGSGTAFVDVKNDIGSNAILTFDQIMTADNPTTNLIKPESGDNVDENDARIRVANCKGTLNSYPRTVLDSSSALVSQSVIDANYTIVDLGSDTVANQFVNITSNRLSIIKSGRYEILLYCNIGMVSLLPAMTQFQAVQLSFWKETSPNFILQDLEVHTEAVPPSGTVSSFLQAQSVAIRIAPATYTAGENFVFRSYGVVAVGQTINVQLTATTTPTASKKNKKEKIKSGSPASTRLKVICHDVLLGNL